MTQPGKPLGMSDFFGLEAGEYLERLDAILAKPEPGADEFARLTRALRGSALMANQAAIARAAAGLEALARAVREGRRAWDVATKQLAVRAVDDLKVLVRRAATWTDADTAKAAALGAELEQLAGRPSGGVRSGDALGLDAGARAFVAREVAEQGRPNPEGPEFQKFAGLAVQFMESEPDVVGVTALYYDDGGPHVVQRGVAAARPAALGRLELVSHGEHLRQAADSLERAPSPTQRELRAHTLAGTFRALANAGGGALAERVARFALVARDVVTSGAAVRATQAFASLLRQAGDLLARSGGGIAEANLAEELDGLIVSLRGLLARASGASVVPIEALTPRATVPVSPDLTGSWT